MSDFDARLQRTLRRFARTAPGLPISMQVLVWEDGDFQVKAFHRFLDDKGSGWEHICEGRGETVHKAVQDALRYGWRTRQTPERWWPTKRTGGAPVDKKRPFRGYLVKDADGHKVARDFGVYEDAVAEKWAAGGCTVEAVTGGMTRQEAWEWLGDEALAWRGKGVGG